MMLRQKSTQWARLKLILFVPVALVVLQAFARPEIAGIEETLLSSEVTTISQEIKKWSKEYFDEKVDEHLKQPNAANHSESWQDYFIDLGQKNGDLFTTLESSKNLKKPRWVSRIEKSDSLFDEMVANELLKYSKKEAMHGALLPQILFLSIEPGTSEKRISDFLDKIGETDEKILKIWESTSVKPKVIPSPNLKDGAILVVINEKISYFPRGETYDNTAARTIINKTKTSEKVEMTEIKVHLDTITGIFKISETKANETIKIFDATGSLKGTFDTQKGTTTIDLTGYERGTYILEYNGKTHKIIRKAVLK